MRAPLQLIPSAVWLLLTMCAAGCSTPSPSMPLAAEPIRLPDLPTEGRQPPVPAWCLEAGSSSCTEALTKRRQAWLTRSSAAAPPALSASEPTMPRKSD